MDARKEIFGRLTLQASGVDFPSPWKSKQNFLNLPDRFKAALNAVKGEVHLAADLDEAWRIVADLFLELNPQKVVATDEPPLNHIILHERFREQEWFIVGKTGSDLRAFCATADVGLTSADAAFAETGSVVVSTGPGRNRTASLLPPVHIALVPTSKLLPDIFSWTETHRGEFPSQVVFISGPSKTADIEQTLVVGVHGPKRFIVILYSD